MSKHIPIRTCICCRKKFDKAQLQRVVKKPNGEIEIDNNNADGRGAYICMDEACRKKLLKAKMLNRSFNLEVNSDIYSVLTANSSEKEKNVDAEKTLKA